MTIDALFDSLSSAKFGAYALTVDQTIVFWNAEAERILGYSAADVVGRRCYEIGSVGISGECLGGCPSLRYVRSGLMPAPSRLNMRCASGELKWVSILLWLSPVSGDSPLLFHLFEDRSPDAQSTIEPIRQRSEACDAPDPNESAPTQASPEEASPLSPRELEVLRLVGLGWDTPRIAKHMGISRHTVSNHIRNLRNKLNVPTKLKAVLAGIRLGILEVDDLR